MCSCVHVFMLNALVFLFGTSVSLFAFMPRRAEGPDVSAVCGVTAFRHFPDESKATPHGLLLTTPASRTSITKNIPSRFKEGMYQLL
jgi:hypothetical protein